MRGSMMPNSRSSRMLEKPASVIGRLRLRPKAEMNKVTSSLNLDLNLSLSLPHSLRPCLRQGASQGEEAALAGSRWTGEISAGAGRVRPVAFLSIPQGCFRLA